MHANKTFVTFKCISISVSFKELNNEITIAEILQIFVC